ncbi:MAG: SDR family oxidoreductase [Trebonia sp.]
MNILLTGATGFLGAFILSELGSTGTDNITCLVRARGKEQARQRITQNLLRYQRQNCAAGAVIDALPGDLSKPSLGLTAEQFFGLAKKIDVIYHNGALVSSMFAPSYVTAVNVVGTSWLAKLATTAVLKELHYISSNSAGQKIPSVYGDSKRRAEEVVIGLASRGAPAAIYRLPRLAHDSRTGTPNESDIVFRLLSLILQTGHAPDIELTEPWIPVDLAARTLLKTAGGLGRDGRRFALMPRNNVSLGFVLDTAGRNGFEIVVEESHDWMARVKALSSPEHDLTLSALGLDVGYGAGLFGDEETPDESEDDQADGFEIVEGPSVDRDTLDRFFAWYRANRIS